jgi:hypothetical protein
MKEGKLGRGEEDEARVEKNFSQNGWNSYGEQ